MWLASPSWPGIHTLSIGSHSSVGPQFFSPRPMQICGKFSRKKFVKCSLDSTTHACTPRLTASSLMKSSAPKKLLRCSSGAASRAEDIIGACEEQYARTISATGPSFLPECRTAPGSCGSRRGAKPAARTEPVEQDLVQAELVERGDVLVVEGLALLVGQLVAGRGEAFPAVAGRVAVDLAGTYPVVDAPVQLVETHRPPFTPRRFPWRRRAASTIAGRLPTSESRCRASSVGATVGPCRSTVAQR